MKKMTTTFLLSLMAIATSSYNFSNYGELVDTNTFCKEDGEFTKCTHFTLAEGVDDQVPNDDDHHKRRLGHTWGDSTWENPNCNLVLQVGDCHTDNGGEDFSTMLVDVVDKWNNVPENQGLTGTTFNPSGISLQYAQCDGDTTCDNTGILGKISSCNSNYGNTGWAGLASVWTYSNNHVAKAMSQVNEYYSMTNAQTQHVLCQEIGHGWPMGHTSEDGSDQNTCMDYSVWTSANRYPNEHDVELLDSLYGTCQTPNTSNKIGIYYICLIVLCLMLYV